MVARLAWRALGVAPSLPAGMPAMERFAARFSHAALYALLLLMPASGWVINSAANIPFRLFWQLPVPPIVAPDDALAQGAKVVHFVLFVLLALLVLVHIGAALRHHFVKHDGVLARMWPQRRSAR
jgi:cytochrome b561